ncbi:hypothetical protein [Streptomyces sp. NBC_01443]|uniref:hypothetical protein n=1 Tax=Streptomyces sp. NBC_01443 TaxID=2903868 RepID=UPI00224ED56C|nr:hypothetical protein [Streptomyces sp. NBC_01443]MCX4631161.1 hypothetical protein [Streptomyces sp. NBC_01443]
MTSRTSPAGAVLLAAGLLALTACGTTVSGSGAAADPSPVLSPGRTPDYAAEAAAAVARHDKLFPEVAQLCEGEESAAPTGSATPGELPTDPAARKYAENHAYKNEATLTPATKCRGDAHAARIKKALGGEDGKGGPKSKEELSGLLTGMGYEPETGSVYASSTGNLSFVLSIPESGPCVTGHLTPPMSVKAHGVYMEGGCNEPRGGH